MFEKAKAKIEKNREINEQYHSQSGTNWLQSFFNVGTRGEYETYRILSSIQGKNKCIANCYVPKEDGTTSEIDMLMIHETGIYVFESKNYSGYIFGSSNQKTWTQTFYAGHGKVEKHQFYNPIMQNKTHIKYLKALLDDESLPIYSYIVFSNRCEFKGLDVDESYRVIHRSNLIKSLNDDIKNRAALLSEDRIEQIFEILDKQSHMDKTIKKEHIQEIRDEKKMINESIKNGICPKCGGKLVLRKASNGPHAVSEFYGCSNYPKCKFSINAQQDSSLFKRLKSNKFHF